MQMEMLEMELIKKLQNTQAIQKQAYAELENALSTNKHGGVMSYTSNGGPGGMHPFGKMSGTHLQNNNNMGGSVWVFPIDHNLLSIFLEK